FEGQKFISNPCSDYHRDSQDPQLAYIRLYAGEDFTGGLVEFPDLKLKVCLEPGNFVLCRGQVLPHKIGDWNDGQRISIPNFTHTSLWRTSNLDDLVSVC
ncbi:hypothetical protein BDZ94DRAFT_1180268, partial [Collybia nuda]